MRFLVVLGSVCLLAWSADAASSRPNILLIVADDLGYGELSCQGGDIPTPNIDSIAKHGVRFTNGYVTAPFCAASRAAMMTGRYQTRFGFEFNPIGPKNADPAIGLPVKETTLAERLRASGYATGIVGKWHLGGTAAYHPARRGFDEFFGFLHEGHYYVPPPWKRVTTWLRRKALPDGGEGRWTSPDGHIVWSTHMGGNEPDYDADNPLLRMSQPVEERKNLTDAFGREAEDFIHRHASQPFFLYLAYNAVHSPLQAEEKYLKKFEHIGDIQRRIFAAMLAHLDDSVGDVLEQIQKEGIEENTLIFFLSDNGGPTKELTSSNAPLRGGKGELWDGGIRVPFMTQWKGHLPAGKVIDQPVISTDIAATAEVLAGLKPKHQDGIDLLPHLIAETASLPERPLYWRVGNKGALRRGDWKIVRNAGKGASAAWQLYNLASDIGEENDLANKEPKKLDELVGEWERLNREMVEAAW
ncbi:MAG: sulfatase [Prosthecobacter sp.]